MCRVLHVSRSGFYDWRDRPLSHRAQTHTQLLTHIRRVHAEHHEAYGAIKTWRALLAQRIACGRHCVASLRRKAGIEAKRKRRFRIAALHYHTQPASPDLIQRCFRAEAPDRSWAGDMTFIRTREGWLHLAVLLDLFSRRVIGWAMGRRQDEALAAHALKMAVAQRRPCLGLIHHTDQSVLYRARSYRETLHQYGMRPSMGARGSALDNAVVESFFSNLKNELVHHCDFATRNEARTAIFSYIELFYNRRRLHQTLDYRTPIEVEKGWVVLD
jgi:transposase InsO family protein